MLDFHKFTCCSVPCSLLKFLRGAERFVHIGGKLFHLVYQQEILKQERKQFTLCAWAFMPRGSQNVSMHMKVLTWTKWLGISLHIECICPLMMGMILANGRLTCDSLEENHEKQHWLSFFIIINIVCRPVIYWPWDVSAKICAKFSRSGNCHFKIPWSWKQMVTGLNETLFKGTLCTFLPSGG